MRRRFVVTGRVQGVGMRAWVQTQARSLGLAGWTRNARDGSVEIEAEGDAGTIASFERLLHQGPRYAVVGAVTSSESAADSGDAVALPQPFAIVRD